MAKNELLENILDDLSLIKDKDLERDSRLDRIESAINELVKRNSVLEEDVPCDVLKQAVLDGIVEYYAANYRHTEVLFEDNIRKIHSVINEIDGEWLKKHWAKEDEVAKHKHDLLVSQRTAQSIYTIPMVAEWAPEYSPEIQRTIRFIGMKMLAEDEPADTAHALLKVWGDALSRITTPPPPEPPSLKAWIKYKRQQAGKSLFPQPKGYGLHIIIYGGIAIMICLSLYQNAVMDLDRTNRIFYHNVIKNTDGSKDYHELDSLIHSNDFFKTYRTLDR